MQISCKLSGWDTDLAAFVDYGRTITYLDSSSYVQGSGAANIDVRPGTPVTVTVRLNNPKELALNYTISADSSLVNGTVAAPASTTGAADGITTATFTFTPTEAAEHGDVTFKLGLSAPDINRTFDPATFKVRCDSPPKPVNNLTAGIRTDGRACIGFALPEDYADADIAKAEITYTSTTAGTTKTVTDDVSRDGSGLTTIPSPAPVSSSAGKYVRYFLPDDVIAGNQYTFTVTPIDASGKKCETPTNASITGNELYLGYDPNGGTGSVAAVYGYNATTTTTIAAGTPLSRDGYVFTGWNTNADGSGTAYNPGASYTFGTSSMMLYAQWQQLSNIAISITTPAYQGVTVTQNNTTVTSVTMDKDGTLKLAMPALPGSGAEAETWYVDGVFQVDEVPNWNFKPSDMSPAITGGTHTITATERDSSTGITYSANLVVTVTNDAMVTVIPYGKTATYHMESKTDGSAYTDIYDKISPYSIAKTETTYALWTAVYNWATANGYSIGKPGVSTGDSYPVTDINWTDMIVWCNAYSEMQGLDPCYFTSGGIVIRSNPIYQAGAEATIAAFGTSVVFDRTKNGYRLPTEGEWQYAASGREETAYDQASGASGGASGDYAQYAICTASGSFSSSQECAQKKPNVLGLFDMSGNTWEACSDRYASSNSGYDSGYSAASPAENYCKNAGQYYAFRSGSYESGFGEIFIGNRQNHNIPDTNISVSFRLARTITQ